MTIYEFYEKAKQGGYDFERLGNPRTVGDRNRALFLDPLAFQAVGKVEGWRQESLQGEFEIYPPEYVSVMHRMIDALVEGKTIEEFLETL